MSLTPKQKALIQTFWKAGKFSAEDLRKIFSSEAARIECIERLAYLGLISQEIETNKFIINREKYLEYD